MASSSVGLTEMLAFVSPNGQQQLIDFVREAKDTRGENWLPQIKEEFPTFSWIVELVADRTADEAFEELQAAFSNYPLWMAKNQLIQLHGRLLAEINKPR
jgi:hypothetical protein